MDSDEEATEAGDVNDLYRNSSLAMFDGTALEEESSEDESDDDISMASSGDEIIEDTSDSSGLEIDLDSDSSSMDEDDEDIVFRRHRFHHADTDEEDSSGTDNSDTDAESESDTNSFSSNEYDSSNESLNSDRSDSIHSNDSRDLAWQLAEDGHLGGHARRRRRDSSLLSVDENDDDMDIDPADYELDTDGLNAEELEDVERNLDLFNSMTRGGGDATQIINPTVRGSLNGNSGNGNGAGRPFDSVILHPLLRGTSSNVTDAPADASSLSAETAILCGANSNHLQAYEDIIGGSAVRILENLFSQQRQRDSHGADEPSQPTARQADMEESTTKDAESQENKETLDILKEFQPSHTTDRWTQEAHMVYIPAVASAKASKVASRIAAELKDIQKDEPNTEEEEQHAVEQSEEAHDIFLNATSSNDDGSSSEIEVQLEVEEDEEDDEDDEDEEENLDPNEQQQDRVVVMIHGEEVDITGTGIDVEFLEALPDDLRAEVISQQMAERRPSIESMDQDEISPEFLAALPPDIRNEVLRQESIDRSRRQARDFLDTEDMDQLVESNNANNNPPNIAVNTTELEGVQMHPNLGLASRVNFSITQPVPGTGSGGPTPSRDDANATWRIGRTSNADQHTSRDPAKPSNHHKDAIRIVDKSQLATLARLVFVPQSISKALLNRLLLSLCENSKTRSDLLSLLVCILQDGSTDLAAVDRSFMDLSIHNVCPC
ncbi:hypothetical protein G6F42_018562 [Rhizopus arrhizus]|nr:hypothetical protein G6F42_018562 [Rhizopus arrhizus]